MEAAPETDLARLLGSVAPELQPDVHVFATIAAGSTVPDGLDPLLVLREEEGRTLVVTEEAAGRAGLAAAFRSRLITLTVNSSLEAVGFLAAVTGRLAASGIAVNPVAGFHHDHLLVPADRAGEALLVLAALAAKHRS